MKDLLTTIEIIIFINLAWRTARFLMGKKHKKSLIGKVALLISRQLHGSIDSRLREQNKRLAETTRQAKSHNVIRFDNYKRKQI